MTYRARRSPLLTVLTVTALGCAAALAAGCTSSGSSTSAGPGRSAAPPAESSSPSAPVSAPVSSTPLRPAHIVVVIEENHSSGDIIGNSSAPYLNSLAAQGANFTQSFAVTHPSEPNYLALFSGSTQGLTDDSCPHSFTGANLAGELIAAGDTFAGYSESMPSSGYTGCTAGAYARKHNPWVDFAGVPAADNRTFAAFPRDFNALPTVAFVVPNLLDDMHDGTVAQADSWLRTNLNAYAQWARTHNSELIVTWDEDDNGADNHIPTLMVGAHVKPGTYAEKIDHYNVLRTLEDFYGLPHARASEQAAPITDAFAASAAPTTP